MAEIAVIGSKVFCDGFRLAGVSRTFHVEDDEGAKSAFKGLRDVDLVIAEYGLRLPRVSKPITVFLSMRKEQNAEMIDELESECRASIGGLTAWEEKL